MYGISLLGAKLNEATGRRGEIRRHIPDFAQEIFNGEMEIWDMTVFLNVSSTGIVIAPAYIDAKGVSSVSCRGTFFFPVAHRFIS